jgi:hypothetical protein
MKATWVSLANRPSPSPAAARTDVGVSVEHVCVPGPINKELALRQELSSLMLEADRSAFQARMKDWWANAKATAYGWALPMWDRLRGGGANVAPSLAAGAGLSGVTFSGAAAFGKVGANPLVEIAASSKKSVELLEDIRDKLPDKNSELRFTP